MKKLLTILTILFASCTSIEKPVEEKADTTTIEQVEKIPDSLIEYSTEDWYQTMYVVIVDTGNNYYELDQRMYEISHKTNIAVDTIGRYYDAGEDKIMLPEDDEVEIYAGDYFPRRYADETLSIEYAALYRKSKDLLANDNTMALVSGIFETIEAAKEQQKKLAQHNISSFIQEASLYMGCMH